MASFVFNYLISSQEEKEKTNQIQLVDAAKTCSHRVFAYLMINDYFDLSDWEILGSILRLPLAVNVDPKGNPHLTPEFGFIGEFFQNVTGLGYLTPDDKVNELANTWKKFFQSYSSLRIEKNNGKNFPHADLIYNAAIASVWKNENCYEHSSQYKSSCVMKSLTVLHADILCALEYCNEIYYPFLHENLFVDWSSDQELDQDSVKRLMGFTNIQLSLVDYLVVKEGWYDLACSMFAFYLVVAIIFSKGNLDAIEDLPKVIRLLRGLPRFEYVSRAIDFACSVALENGRSTTFARLDQFRQSIDEEIKSLIAGGESQLCEFKSTLRRNLHTGQDDHKIEHSVLKTISGFLNKEGGQLLIGVSDDRDITGIEADGFESFDKWQLHFKNLVNQALPSAMDFIEC